MRLPVLSTVARCLLTLGIAFVASPASYASPLSTTNAVVKGSVPIEIQAKSDLITATVIADPVKAQPVTIAPTVDVPIAPATALPVTTIAPAATDSPLADVVAQPISTPPIVVPTSLTPKADIVATPVVTTTATPIAASVQPPVVKAESVAAEVTATSLASWYGTMNHPWMYGFLSGRVMAMSQCSENPCAQVMHGVQTTVQIHAIFSTSLNQGRTYSIPTDADGNFYTRLPIGSYLARISPIVTCSIGYGCHSYGHGDHTSFLIHPMQGTEINLFYHGGF